MLSSNNFQKILDCFKNKTWSLKKLSNAQINFLNEKLKNYFVLSKENYVKNTYKINSVKVSIYNTNSVVITYKNENDIKKLLDVLTFQFFKTFIKNDVKDINNLSKLEKNNSIFSKKNYYTNIGAGSDESGKGDFYGGMTFAACNITEEIFDKLKQESLLLKIKDSKLLSNAEIIDLAPKLMKTLGKNNYHVYNMSPSQYNFVYDITNNLNILMFMMHKLCWIELKNKIEKPWKNYALDAFCTFDKIFNYEGLSNRWLCDYFSYKNLKHEHQMEIKFFVTKAESKFLAVAIASIIARYFFIKQIEQLSQEYNSNIPFGNSYEGKNNVYNAFVNLIKNNKEKYLFLKDFKKCNAFLKNICKFNFKTKENLYSYIIKTLKEIENKKNK